MFPLRRIGRFLALVLVFYAVLMVPWPGLAGAYATVFRAAGELLFGSIGSQGWASLEPMVADEGTEDTAINLTHARVPGRAGQITISSRYTGYVPTAAVVALVLATPLDWRRKGRALLWSLVLVHVFIALRLGLPIYRGFCLDDEFRQFALSPLQLKVLEQTIAALLRAPASLFVVPIFIWIAATFRRKDLKALGTTKKSPGDGTSRAVPASEPRR
ncbi:MAG: hypothetical protein ACYSVY_21255 [Planctomycetota bacterium]|jgi:hypothetical protein